MSGRAGETAAASTSGGFGPLAAIRRDFPGWHPWRSSAGRYWATRITRRRRPAGAGAEWAMTVTGADAAALRDELDRQERADSG